MKNLLFIAIQRTREKAVIQINESYSSIEYHTYVDVKNTTNITNTTNKYYRYDKQILQIRQTNITDTTNKYYKYNKQI